MRLETLTPGNRKGLPSLECGGCTACCRAMAVPELPKPEFSKCPHQKAGGCRIYDERPAACEHFQCGYITRHLDRWGSAARPDLSQVIVWGMRGTIWGDMLTVTECVQGASDQGIGAKMLAELSKTQLVLVISSVKRCLVGPPALVNAARLRIHEKLG